MTSLCACAIIPGPRGGGGGGSIAPLKTLTFAAIGGQDQLTRSAAGAVQDALEARGYRFDDDAQFEIVLGLAKRPVEIGFQPGENPRRQEQQPYPSALPEGRRLDLCREAIYRLSLVIVGRSNNAVVYRGAAEHVRCGALEKDNLKALANVAIDLLR